MDDRQILSVIYHDLFDYPLTAGELIKWEAGQKLQITNYKLQIENKHGYYYLKGREGLVSKRLIRKRVAGRKMIIARRAAQILRLIPTVKLVGVTGSLAMANAKEEADIDLLLITSAQILWLTRILASVLLGVTGFKLRRYGDRNEQDKLCLNMWLDETALVWPNKDRNIYTAHELGQILPLVNKNSTYEQMLCKNKWIKDFWPNVTKVHSTKYIVHRGNKFLNKLAYWIQRQYMRGKITREIITENKAIFHPVDWSLKVAQKLLNFKSI